MKTTKKYKILNDNHSLIFDPDTKLTEREAWLCIADCFNQSFNIWICGIACINDSGLCKAVSKLYISNTISYESYKIMKNKIRSFLLEDDPNSPFLFPLGFSFKHLRVNFAQDRAQELDKLMLI